MWVPFSELFPLPVGPSNNGSGRAGVSYGDSWVGGEVVARPPKSLSANGVYPICQWWSCHTHLLLLFSPTSHVCLNIMHEHFFFSFSFLNENRFNGGICKNCNCWDCCLCIHGSYGNHHKINFSHMQKNGEQIPPCATHGWTLREMKTEKMGYLLTAYLVLNKQPIYILNWNILHIT